MRTLRPSPLAIPAVDLIWIDAARDLGFAVVRTPDAYASSDGAGAIAIGTQEILDADDAVAQLIFHELCHALVEGPARQALPDWGLDNSGAGDVVREYACLRLQAHLAAPFGLRELMAPTTEYRSYHDRLPGDVLASDGDPATGLAREAAARAAATSWGRAIARALSSTAAHVQSARDDGDGDVHPLAPQDVAAGKHPVGFALGPADQTCGGCAWFHVGGRGRGVPRCRQAEGGAGAARRTHADLRACDRWEAPVDCRTCGACCREAYHAVSVSMRDPVVWKQPKLVVRHGPRFEILRDGDRCAALGSRGIERYTCSIYEDRPQACRDFAAGGRHCLDARRRVGLSR
ncbi:MAG TPA: YkgJ family cysteine cluster protein [Polyangia bacterium]|nr:YkgJ family cysteine cluster protein [Polyangia bacterium]